VITISRESYNSDVDAELNRAIDWLLADGIDRVIVTGDFHLSTQMVGADTSEFYPALKDTQRGLDIATAWSRTARRLADEFRVSVGYLHGKRCLGGMLELLMHCHYLVAGEDAQLGMPEVTLPVVPGMEGCHWPFRKARKKDWPKIVEMLLSGRFVRAKDARGWLVDFAGGTDACLKMAWSMAMDGDHGVTRRKVVEGAISDGPTDGKVPVSDDPAVEGARKAIMACIQDSCRVPLSEAIDVQAGHSGDFMADRLCQKGAIGSEAAKVLDV
jgi:enoyl-CoA hydratase/carnithine racemase